MIRHGRPLPIILAALLAGCSLSRPYPAKELHALDVPPPAGDPSGAGETVMRVLPVRMTEPFGDRAFHYRIGGSRIDADYYTTFVDEPGRLLTAELIEWLAQTGAFPAVVDAASGVSTNRSLQLVVNELYGDLRDPGVRRAVVSVRVFLLDESRVETSVLLARDYREAETVVGEDGDALVEGWGKALARVFARIAADIRTIS